MLYILYFIAGFLSYFLYQYVVQIFTDKELEKTVRSADND